jgi:hypothetical protein
MFNLNSRSIVLITCLVGTTIAVACISFGRNQPVAAYQPCSNDLVVVEPQPDAPVRISVLQTNCGQPDFADVSFKVKTTGTRRISRYEVRMNAGYEGISRSDSTIISGFGSIYPEDPEFYKHQESSEFIGVTLKRGLLRSNVDQLKLFVQSVTFNDGTVWNRPADPARSN